MLVTQNNNFTSWNSSFNKQEQGNSNETFKLEFPTEIEIQSNIKTALENLLKNSIIWTGKNVDELAQSIFEKAKILEQTKV